MKTQKRLNHKTRFPIVRRKSLQCLHFLLGTERRRIYPDDTINNSFTIISHGIEFCMGMVNTNSVKT